MAQGYDPGWTARWMVSIATLSAVTAAMPAAAQDIVATSKPAHTLVQMVLGNAAMAKVLIDGSASPHTYQMRPSDAKAVGGARVLVRISEGLEPFSSRLAKSLPKGARLITLAAAPGLVSLPQRTGTTFEADDHDHGHKHGAKESDAHIWLDPMNAKVLVSYLAAELGKVMPDKAPAFAANADRAATQIDALNAEIARELAGLQGKPFVVFHDSLQYLEKRYGLAAVGSIVVSPEVQPGAKRLSDLRAKITKLGAVCVFAEPRFEPKLVASVTQGTKARGGTLDPEGTMLKPGEGFYAELMRGLATGLKTCLSAA